MEATGVYWKPVRHVLSGGEVTPILANAAPVKNVPGEGVRDREGLVPGPGEPPVHGARGTTFEGGVTVEAGGHAGPSVTMEAAAPHSFACSRVARSADHPRRVGGRDSSPATPP